MTRATHTFTVVRDGVSIELEARAEGTFSPGSYGLPEDSSPDEGEITECEIFFNDEPWKGTLTDAEQDKLDAALMEAIVENQSDDYDPGEWYDADEP